MQKKKNLSDELAEVLKCFPKDKEELLTGSYTWNYEESKKNFRYLFIFLNNFSFSKYQAGAAIVGIL